MHRQQPVLQLDTEGAAQKGLIVRHLILPGQTGDSIQILNWLAENLSPSIGLSLMSQYYPCYQAPPDLQRTLSVGEYKKVLQKAMSIGFENLFVQSGLFSPEENLVPDFNRQKPFDWNNSE
jgi:putative pyruvate formate lyase activating enzyme